VIPERGRRIREVVIYASFAFPSGISDRILIVW
jgi:hypothetical protein